MGKRDADVITVSIIEIDNWEHNPKNIKKTDFSRLKSQIIELGHYRPLLC